MHLEFLEDAPTSVLGFLVRDKDGVDILGTNTWEERRPLPRRQGGQTLVVDFLQRLPLQSGTYSVTVALSHGPSQPAYFDWVDNAVVFEMLRPSGKHVHGKVGLPVEVSVHG